MKLCPYLSLEQTKRSKSNSQESLAGALTARTKRTLQRPANNRGPTPRPEGSVFNVAGAATMQFCPITLIIKYQ